MHLRHRPPDDECRKHVETLIQELRAAPGWDHWVDSAEWFLYQIGWCSQVRERETALRHIADLTEPLVYHYLLLQAYPARLRRARAARERAARLRAHRERAWWVDEIISCLRHVRAFRRGVEVDDAEVFHAFTEELAPHLFENVRSHYEELHHPAFLLRRVDALTDPVFPERQQLLDFLRQVSALHTGGGLEVLLGRWGIRRQDTHTINAEEYCRTRRPIVFGYFASMRYVRVTGWLPRLSRRGHRREF